MIIQPSYLPWLGFFEMLYRSDCFVSYDTAQYTKNDWRNRNLIRTDKGKLWLTVPTQIKGKWPLSICEVKVNNNTDWRRKHLSSFKQYYGKTPFFNQLFPFLEEEINRDYQYLQELNIALIKKMMNFLGFDRPIIRTSSLDMPMIEGKTEKLVWICSKLKADIYYATQASSRYIDRKLFSDAGIELIFQDYRHPEYAQRYRPFLSHLSAIDILFNEGPNSIKKILNF